MDRFMKPIKPATNVSKSTAAHRSHPYKSKLDLLKERCCTPRPVGNIFTSSITGHQVSQGAGGRATSYFVSRNTKLARQFSQANTPLSATTFSSAKPLSFTTSLTEATPESVSSGSSEPLTEILSPAATQLSPAIFRNCTIYINGYMGPLVSDIELKKRLSRYGARVVTNFGKRSVTHVILGPNGLAGGKIQKEMLARKVGVKYVTVDWALDSLREGKRMVETRYAIIRHEKQSSMFEILQKEKGAGKDVVEIDTEGVENEEEKKL